MIDFGAFDDTTMESDPFPWAVVSGLFGLEDARRLVDDYPMKSFRTIEAYGGEKDYKYDVRNVVAMDNSVSHLDDLSEPWRELAEDLRSPHYRESLTALTGVDLAGLVMEANVYHYAPGAMLGPHCDLPEKVLVHVLYFNDDWEESMGGCLAILRSADPSDVAAVVLPNVGSSALFVRSDNSWHEVRRVAEDCHESRRSLVVTFYEKGSRSPMWISGEKYSQHTFGDEPEPEPTSVWTRLTRRFHA
jgi:hypothetical protein